MTDTRLRRASRDTLLPLFCRFAVIILPGITNLSTLWCAVTSLLVPGAVAFEGVTLKAEASSSSPALSVVGRARSSGGVGRRGRQSLLAFAHPPTFRPVKRGHLCYDFAAHYHELGEKAPQPPPSTEEGMELVEPTMAVATSAILRISYDGSHCHGWSAANHDQDQDHDEAAGNDYDDLTRLATPSEFFSSQKRRRGSRRNRRGHLTGMGPGGKRGRGVVRTVERTIRACLAKIHGNVDRDMVSVVGCSRTDRGVHSRATVAHVFFLLGGKSESPEASTMGVGTSDECHAHKHPTSVHDLNFEPLPFGGDLSQLMYVLNRMLPPDVRVADVCLPPNPPPVPFTSGSGKVSPTYFHPTLCANTKTYRYTFAVPRSGDDDGGGSGGNNGAYLLYDPLRWRHVWHVQSPSVFDWDVAREAAEALVGTNDYSSFRGAYRGSERKNDGVVNKNPVCTVTGIVVRPEEEGREEAGVGGLGPGGATYGTIEITGDRFLYKMCRFIVAAVVSCGTGAGGLTVDRVRDALTVRRTPEETFECAPAHGLELQDVVYGEEWTFHWLLQGKSGEAGEGETMAASGTGRQDASNEGQ